MNELTIEQKAQRYEKALERAKKWYNAPNINKMPTYGNRVIEEIFPELKESDESKDERIRKELIDYHRSMAAGADDYVHEAWIAWLEAQGNIDSQVKLPTFTFDDVLALQCCMETVKKVQEDKELYEQLQSLHDRLYDVYWLEKQGEQKPSWSEEDEVGLGDAMWAIKQAKTIAKDENDMGNLWYAERWLKDLKERVGCEVNYTTTKEWSEEDEEYINDLIGVFDGQQYQAHSYEEIVNWLKSLKPQSRRACKRGFGGNNRLLY